MPRLLPLVAALSLAVSCHDSKSGGQDGPGSAPTRAATPTRPATRPVSARDQLLSSRDLVGAAQVPFETVTAGEVSLKGHYSGLDEELTRVVTDQASFDQLFARIFSRNEPVPGAPKIDFTKRCVIAVSLGTRSSGGYGIEVDSIVEKDGEVHVIVREREPGPGEIVTMALTQAYHVVSTPRVAPQSVRFQRYKNVGD